MTLRITAFTFAAATGLALLFASETPSVAPQTWTSQAQAVIGRPLTPLSYAGVARRTTRRAVVAGAAVGAATAAPVYVAPAPSCVQVVDAYGRIYWRCP
jgi:hypothetical protein